MIIRKAYKFQLQTTPSQEVQMSRFAGRCRFVWNKALAVPPAYTSQRCSRCGHARAANRVSQAVFRCRVCGLKINADLNAARNILAAGHAAMACEANGAVMPSAAGTHRSEVQPCTAQ